MIGTTITKLAGGFLLGVVLRFLLRQFFILNADRLLDPFIRAMWEHAIGYANAFSEDHFTPSIMECSDCQNKLLNFPN